MERKLLFVVVALVLFSLVGGCNGLPFSPGAAVDCVDCLEGCRPECVVEDRDQAEQQRNLDAVDRLREDMTGGG